MKRSLVGAVARRLIVLMVIASLGGAAGLYAEKITRNFDLGASR